jgi:hypothetical protein
MCVHSHYYKRNGSRRRGQLSANSRSTENCMRALGLSYYERDYVVVTSSDICKYCMEEQKEL